MEWCAVRPAFGVQVRARLKENEEGSGTRVRRRPVERRSAVLLVSDFGAMSLDAGAQAVLGNRAPKRCSRLRVAGIAVAAGRRGR